MFTTTIKAEYEYVSEEKESLVHFLVEIKTDKLEQDNERKALNISLVLDRSGSMGGNKIVYTRQAAAHLIRRLQDDDTISLVCYDSQVDVLSPPVSGSRKAALERSLEKAVPRSSTNLSAGWLQGLSLVDQNLQKDSVHRVLLLTDGLANEGVKTPEGLVAIGRAHLEKGIRTTTLGFGNDFNEDLLTKIADESGGNFYFIDSPERAPEVFLEELGELASIIGQNLEVVMRCEPGVTVDSNLSKFPGHNKDQEIVWKVGDLYANDTRLLLFSLKIPAGFAKGQKALAHIGLRFHSLFDSKEKRSEAPVAVHFDSNEAANRGPNEEVLREVLVMKTAFIKEKATSLADQGDYTQAQQLLQSNAVTLRGALQNSSLAFDDEAKRFLEEEARVCDDLQDRTSPENYSPYNRKMMLMDAYRSKKQRGKYKK